nr:gas vesicle protein [Gandjariella thermophila]
MPADRPGQPLGARSVANLADILERVLDKGIVIAGDIKINLLDIELLTIKLRLLVASVDRAREMGIDWWEHDPSLSSSARRNGSDREVADRDRDELAGENARLRARIEQLTSGEIEGGRAEPEPQRAGGARRKRGSGASR